MAHSIIELASSLSKNTETYHDYLTENNLPLPTHDIDLLHQQPGSQPLPQEIAAALETAIEASHDLHQLLLGPVGCVMGAAAEVIRAFSPLQRKLKSVYSLTNC